jgi:hypothetical protein
MEEEMDKGKKEDALDPIMMEEYRILAGFHQEVQKQRDKA